MHRAKAVIITVNQRIGHRLAEGAHVHLGHRHAEQPHLQFIFRVIGTEVGLQPVQHLQKRKTAELVEAHRLLGQHLKSNFMSGEQLPQ